jgi:signal transduction histidine kinase
VTVESRLGSGSVFTLEVPVRQIAAASAPVIGGSG